MRHLKHIIIQIYAICFRISIPVGLLARVTLVLRIQIIGEM